MLESDPSFMESFQRASCLVFCQKLQGRHVEVSHHFSINYDGVKTRFGPLEFLVSEKTISEATKIPIWGEKWFKGMAMDLSYCNDCFKPEHQNVKLTMGVPRGYMI